MKLRIVQKIRFSLHESRWTKAWCPGLVSWLSAKAQEPVARSRGLVIQPRKLSVGAYFELLFLGCGFLIYLSNRSLWKKIRQKYGTQQELSLFKGHPLWFPYSSFQQVRQPSILSAKAQELEARIRGLVIQPPKLSIGAYFELLFLGCGFLIHLSNMSDSPRFRAPWKRIRQKYGTRQEPSLFKGIYCPTSMEMHYLQ